MIETTDKPTVDVPKPEDLEQKKKAEFEKARKEFEEKAKLSKLFIEAKKAFREGRNGEAFKKFLIFGVSVFAKNLKDLRSDVDKKRKEKQLKSKGKKPKPQKEVKDKDNRKKKDVKKHTKKKEPSPERESVKKTATRRKAKLKQLSGKKKKIAKVKLFPTLATAFPDVEIQDMLTSLHYLPQVIYGKPGWEKGNRTGNWDQEAAGNTDQTIAEGKYYTDSVLAPPGYTRESSYVTQVPKDVHNTLSKMAVFLNKTDRMPFFTGIAVKIRGKDGKTYDVMLVKEIHTWKKGTGTDGQCRPHGGVSYIVNPKQF